MTIVQRLFKFIDVPTERGACWEWTGHKVCGYGGIRINGRGYRAHRVMYELIYDRIPAGAMILHECDNPACVNPEHLQAGTGAENTRQMIERGRQRTHRGEQLPHTKLTADNVRDIRKRHAAGETQRSLAREYSVNATAVHAIVHRRNWKHIEGEA